MPRGRLIAVLALMSSAAACAGPEPAPAPKPRPGFTSELPARVDTAAAPLAVPTQAEGEMLGFPTPGNSGNRDYSMEETTGALKGYVTRFYRIRHVQGSQLIGILNNWKSAQGRIVDVPSHNMLIITEQKDTLAVLEKVLEQVDHVPAQVEIEAKVIEIRRQNNYEFGFELHFDRTPAANTAFRKFDGTFDSPSFVDSLRPGATPYQGASMNWAAVGKAIKDLGDFDYIIRALEKDGYAEVLSAPRVVVHSGNPAIIRAMTKVPIQITNIVNTNLQQISTSFENVGVQLEVKPIVVGTEAILLDAKPTVSSVVQNFLSTTASIPIPVIAERSAQTQVDIRNGEILVIGGLYERRIRKNTSRVPVLGYLPLIGKLFSSIDDEEQKTEVIFILKLKILTSVERADARLKAIPGENVGPEDERGR
jgi:general secretion pathway protein D